MMKDREILRQGKLQLTSLRFSSSDHNRYDTIQQSVRLGALLCGEAVADLFHFFALVICKIVTTISASHRLLSSTSSSTSTAVPADCCLV